MVIAGRRSYVDAVRWLKAARPHRIDRGRFAARSFGGSFVAGLIVLGLFGLFAPSRFGAPGSRALGGGEWTLALGALVAAAGLVGLLQARRLVRLYRRVREPFIRPFAGDEHFEGAADCLAASPGAFQWRWATSWVWGPALSAVAGVTFAFGSAYFVVAVVLSGGRIGWSDPAFAAANAVLGMLSFALGAKRLLTWPLALSVHREVTGRYAD